MFRSNRRPWRQVQRALKGVAVLGWVIASAHRGLARIAPWSLPNSSPHTPEGALTTTPSTWHAVQVLELLEAGTGQQWQRQSSRAVVVMIVTVVVG